MTDVNIRVKTSKPFRVTTQSGIIMARKLADLTDVDLSDLQDKYVLMYDAQTQKYKAVNPDAVLAASIEDPISPGLPQVFVDYLNQVIQQLLQQQPQLKFEDLVDVDASQVGNKYVIMYNSSIGKYQVVNPDLIFEGAISDPNAPGLPPNFITYLNETIIPQFMKLNDIFDVDTANVADKFVIMYNASTQQYEVVNPDAVLSAAVTENTEPGLPNEFLDKLDEDLDNRIDFDGGEF